MDIPLGEIMEVVERETLRNPDVKLADFSLYFGSFLNREDEVEPYVDLEGKEDNGMWIHLKRWYANG
jgi:hypothetical protein